MMHFKKSSSNGPLDGKIALITGGSKGIGRATAVRLARGGAKVVINYSSDSKAADEAIAEIGKDNAFAIQGNAASVQDIERMVAQTVEKFGKIDILIPNAGALPMRDLEHTTEEDFDKTIALMVKGPYFLTQVCSHTHKTTMVLANSIFRKLRRTCQRDRG
jgi:3-oxoacyl-[acyl-carrier protein] reductase